MRPFDSVVVVDWSASATPSPARPSADAIWIGISSSAGTDAAYYRTRAHAETALVALLDRASLANHRVLIGFDFPMGYPPGFAARLTGVPEAKSVWQWLAAYIQDGPDNRNNRFAVAANINAQWGGGGPFWGRPAGLQLPDLPDRKTVNYAHVGIAERRQIETLVPRAQPVWKLYTTGSVGSQALMGLPMIYRLSQRPGTAVWPFDPPDANTVLAEVYPSLLASAVAQSPGIKDEAQVRLLSRALFVLSQTQQVAPLFVTPPAPVTTEEGWILGADHAALLLKALV